MFDPSSFANTTPLAHADTSRDVLPRGVQLYSNLRCLVRRFFEENNSARPLTGTVTSQRYASLLEQSVISALQEYQKIMVHRNPITYLSDLKESIECHGRNIPQFID
ncbi:hypothetical protein TNCV_700471 [Trichonephila clavipes]|nr:hypothetical protein TNCV_700471 [Trichonephila clavipes]